MRKQTQSVNVTEAKPAETHLDKVASYEDEDGFVICDRKNPKAWVKSDTAPKAER